MQIICRHFPTEPATEQWQAWSPPFCTYDTFVAKSDTKHGAIAILKWVLGAPEGDPRDPDYSREGIFQHHNCAYCADGTKPCVGGNPHQCEYPHARND